MRRLAWIGLLAIACEEPQWGLLVSTSEDLAAGELESTDDCVLTYETAEVVVDSYGLIDGSLELVEAQAPWTIPLLLELAVASPLHEAPVDRFAGLWINEASGDSSTVRVAGRIACPTGEVSFDWTLPGPPQWRCLRDGLDLGTSSITRIPVDAELLRLFEDDGGGGGDVRLESFISADTNLDGLITLEELSEYELWRGGYTLGPLSTVRDLAAFIRERAEVVLVPTFSSCRRSQE